MGPLRDMILEGKASRGMIIGKGSLFLGRMTNLFDGVSFVVEANPGKTEEKPAQQGVSAEEIRALIAESMRDFAESLLK